MSVLCIRSLQRICAKYVHESNIVGAQLCSKVPAVNEAFASLVADEFEYAPHAPHEPSVQSAYRKLCDEVLQQWETLVAHDYQFEVWRAPTQPYASSKEMQDDVRQRHLSFYPTFSGHGDVSHRLDQKMNPLLQPSGVVRNGEALTFNDLFRAVHDVFGHAAEGHGFGPIGEENAFRAHGRMFTPLARQAMTTETRGQNSWFNFGPHLRTAKGQLIRPHDSRYVPPRLRRYAPQKMTLLPAFCWGEY